ncbi:DNA topoisomerase II [Thraustotheca clavata]|uniref:DNA topoisomerase (ATP-hydrolyzing) n=1 Tax=Thraustotheca clavata TaxID=74557 RepID=A0A1V9ZH33_9STRA|nr:DNA topoisomerase II [Thraustotheca clavata]
MEKKSKSKSKKNDSSDEEFSSDTSSTRSGLTVEQIYQKKTQLEHILLRPDTYVGSIEPVTQNMWVFDEEEKKMVNKKITFCPGLYKIFDEIIVNACDNKQRDKSMDTLKVTFDQETGAISVWNNGRGIPVVEHKEHKVYVPELIFGHLLTGSNFDDNKKKTTGGRNGYGAKLANIFSTEFIVETANREDGKRYRQVFKKNMSVKEEPKITSWSKKDFTCITFTPDFTRFQMTGLDSDIIALFKKRVYDIAGVTDKSLSVYLNEEKIDVKTFPQYVEMYNPQEVVFDKPDERWHVGIGISDDGFQQVSFVNGICTTKGGQHVNYIADQIATKLSATIKKKNKGDPVKPALIKNHLFIYMTALIDNPAFDSQTKETLTTRANAFGSTFTLSDKFLKQVEKSSLVERILSFAKFKQTADLKKAAGGGKKKRLQGISKLDDANFAGSAKSHMCTLILTEGDSAKALAMSGLSVVGRDYYGVFPLRGKLLNVREAAHSAIVKNEEVTNIVKILGLEYNKKYESTKNLRYGHLMIMADQDHDGSHIKGLVINFIHNYWPSLLGLESFVQEFITPIIKATKGNRVQVFYTMPEYETWRQSTNNGRGWDIKYYKGLGTSTAKEAKEYFSDLNTHQIAFTYEKEKDDDAIELAFSKKRIEDRKEWLRAFVPGTYIDYSMEDMGYSDFVNKELILFSMADNIRSIPSMVDGFKPSQRKVLFSCFKRNLKKEIKVAQLAGYVSEHSAYHHGEASLHGTIIGMAQDYVGSNNLNLLSPNGQFGTRLQGGKDAASARYVFTKLENLTRLVYHPLDDSVLNYLEEEGLSIEPDFYMPIIPMALINGNEGIGTGWSCGIPNYNPNEVIANIRRRIQAEPMTPMQPWYRGFTGSIVQKGTSDNFLVQGKFEVVDEGTIVISELPIKTWTQTYKERLEKMIESNDIKDFKENHTDTTVLFTISLEPAKLAAIQQESGGILKKFKLESSMATSNMHMFNAEGKIKLYKSPLEVIEEFYTLRIDYYGRRKVAILKKLDTEIMALSNKMRFILAVIDGSLVVNNRKKKDLLEELRRLKYDPMPKKAAAKSSDEEDIIDEEEPQGEVSAGDYDYLLSMPLWSLTAERVEILRNDLHSKEAERDTVFGTSLEDMWLHDLEVLEKNLEIHEENRLAQEASALKKFKGAASKRAPAKKKAAKRKANGSDDENSESDFEVKVPKVKAPPKKKAATGEGAKPAMKKEKPIKAEKAAKSDTAGKKMTQTTLSAFSAVKDEPKPVKEEKPAPKPRAPKKAPAQPKKLLELKRKEDSSDDDGEVLSLFERLQRRKEADAAKSKAAPSISLVSTSAKTEKDEKKTIDASSDEEVLASIESRAAKAKAKPAPKPRAKKVMKKKEDPDDTNGESEDDVEITPAAPRARSGRGKAVVYSVSSDEEQDDGNVLVIGGGPAGVFCAQAIRRQLQGARIVVIEGQRELLKKVRLSGGGRCNVTHAKNKFHDIRDVMAQYPRGGKALLSNLSRFGIEESHQWFEAEGVTLKTEADGRVFPTTNTSTTIVDTLLHAAQDVEIYNRTKVTQLQRGPDGNYTVQALAKADTAPKTFNAKCVVVATGSSVPFWDLLQAQGVSIAPPVPSLFTFKTNDTRVAGLSGVAVEDTKITLPSLKKLSPVYGPTLITHFGLSGPAILRQSAFAALEMHKANYRLPVCIDWTGGRYSKHEASLLLHDQRQLHPTRKIASFCPFIDQDTKKPLIPQRLWARLAMESDLPWANMPKTLCMTIAENISACTITTSGKSTYKDEFVTAGGVELHQLSKDLEVKALPRLFIVGECLNVDGVTGGFNFTNCWSSVSTMKQRGAMALEDLEITRRISSSSMVDSHDHLQVLTELADVREKYYRLGAEMRRLRQKEMHTSALQEEVDNLRHLLGRSQSREEELTRQVQILHTKVTESHKNEEWAVKTKKTKTIEMKEENPWKMQELEGTVLHQKLEIQELKEEQDVMNQELLKYKRLYEEMQVHCARLEDSVQMLEHENETLNDENVSTSSANQLEIDNRRLVLLLMNTTEFSHFKFYSTLDKVSYCSSDSFGSDDFSPQEPKLKADKDDSLAWGRLVRDLAQVYPTHNESVHYIHFQTEERQWVPSKILTLVSIHKIQLSVATLLKKINGAWQKAYQSKLQEINEANKREAAESQRRSKQMMPYDAVVNKREIHRLKQEILQLYNEKLQGRAVRAPETTRRLYSSTKKK